MGQQRQQRCANVIGGIGVGNHHGAQHAHFLGKAGLSAQISVIQGLRRCVQRAFHLIQRIGIAMRGKNRIGMGAQHV